MSSEVAGVGGSHACHFGLLGRCIEGKVHLLGPFQLAPRHALLFHLRPLFAHHLGRMLYCQFLLVLLELQFEAKVRAHIRPHLSDILDGIAEDGVIFFHVVSDDEGGRLHIGIKYTRDACAAVDQDCSAFEICLEEGLLSSMVW
jgi:hypothetical protein